MLNRFPQMLRNRHVARVRAIEAEGNARRAAIRPATEPRRTPGDARQGVPLLRAVPEKTPLNAEGHRHGRARRLHHREGDLREPAGLPRHRESLHAEGRGSSRCPAWSGRAGTRPTARRSRRYQSFAQGLARHGLRRAHLRPDRPGRAAAVRARREGGTGRASASASTCSPATSSSSSASSSAAGGPGTASARSITCCRGRRSIRSTSASPATPAAAR